MNLQRFTVSCLLFLAFVGTPAFSQRSHSSGSRSSYSRSSTSSRPYYGGGHHTESHGGSYGVSGSSHKGGHYTSSTGSHHYGRHK